jgi:hypothetical protein
MLIANATGRQVAKAIGRRSTVLAVDKSVQTYRRARLAALLEHAEFGGNKTTLGGAIGYKNGAFIRQMIDGERPITEKTIAKLTAIRGGKFAGWFADEPKGRPEAWPFELVPRDRFERLTPVQRGVVEAAILQALDKLEAAHPMDSSRKRPNAAA